MELLKSKKFELPILYFISDRNKIKDIPVGVPFIYGNAKDKNRFIRMLEYEVIWNRAVKSGFPFNFRQLLKEAGFTNVKFHDFCENIYLDHKNTGDYDINTIDTPEKQLYIGGDSTLFEEFIEDCSAYVDVKVLKELNVFPVWLAEIETAIETNVHNFAVYNPYMYNKKLDGMYGAIDMQSPNKNLIIIDISASIPRAVGTTCLTLARHLVETFYADLIVTGKETHLFPYEELQNVDIEGTYDAFGQGNESDMFRPLVTGQPRKYTTAIVFGDNHSPCDGWTHSTGKNIGRDDAKKMCTWSVERMISLHTESDKTRAGYGDFFDVKEVKHIKDWVKYIKKD